MQGGESFLDKFGTELLVGVVVTVLLVIGEELIRRLAWPRLQGWWESRHFKKVAPSLVVLLIGYLTHLRDVGKAFGRTRGDGSANMKETMRREVLEPIRGFLPTVPGEQIKVVWFRLDADGKHLRMHEQVGHSLEGQTFLRLTIATSIAGKVYSEGEPYSTGDCENDPYFQAVEKSKATGSLACVPVIRGSEVTGVLSVLSNRDNAFWVSEVAYFAALAAAIGANESDGGNGKSV